MTNETTQPEGAAAVGESACSALLAVEGPSIPRGHADFASEVAALADKYGMNSFTMTYRPSFEQRRNIELDHRISGEMKIVYSSSDGRGRPYRNLQIRCEVDFSIQVESNQSSYS